MLRYFHYIWKKKKRKKERTVIYRAIIFPSTFLITFRFCFISFLSLLYPYSRFLSYHSLNISSDQFTSRSGHFLLRSLLWSVLRLSFIYISLPPVFHPSSLFFFLPFHLFFHSSARYFVPYLSTRPSTPTHSPAGVFSFTPFSPSYESLFLVLAH